MPVKISKVKGTSRYTVKTPGGTKAKSTTKAKATITQTANQSGDLIIGSNSGNNYYNGRIALVRAWNKVLIPAEIQQLYLSPYSPGGLPFFS